MQVRCIHARQINLHKFEEIANTCACLHTCTYTLAHVYDSAYQGLYFWYTGATPHQHYLVHLLTKHKLQRQIAQRS